MIGISNRGKVGDDFFLLFKSKLIEKRITTLEEKLKQFHLSDYIILKSTGKQRLVSEEDIIIFKYSGYMFYKKNVYDINHIKKWLEFNNKNNINILYLSKPFPPIELLDKIKIIDSL